MAQQHSQQWGPFRRLPLLSFYVGTDAVRGCYPGKFLVSYMQFGAFLGHFAQIYPLDPVVDRWSRSSRSKIGQVELIEKSSTSRSSRSSRVDFCTSRVDRLVDD